MTKFQKLVKYWPWFLGLAVLCGLFAWGLNSSIKHTVSAHGPESVDGGLFATFWALITGGTAFSIPALIALVQKWWPKSSGIGVSADPRIAQFIDAAQIGSYLYLLGKAKSTEETAALTKAGRASFDSLRDGLFPLPVPPNE